MKGHYVAMLLDMPLLLLLFAPNNTFCTELPLFCTVLCYLKTAFLLTNQNTEIFSCILLGDEIELVKAYICKLTD